MQFCQYTANEDEEITHKLLGENFKNQIHVIREMFVSSFGNPECQHVISYCFNFAIFDNALFLQWMSPEGFLSLIAMVGTNGQGVGSSALAEWAKNAGELELPQEEKDSLEEFIDNLYSNLEDGKLIKTSIWQSTNTVDLFPESGGFLNCEGSGLYELQSKINHSCDPNAEVCFLHGNGRISLRALKEINPGDEICISYLTPCDLDRSRHSRQKELW